jgi:hypothetical protein
MKMVFPRYDHISREGKEKIKIFKGGKHNFSLKGYSVKDGGIFHSLFCSFDAYTGQAFLTFQYGDQYTTLIANFYQHRKNIYYEDISQDKLSTLFSDI